MSVVHDRSLAGRITDVLIWVVLLFSTILVGMPILYVIQASFSDSTDIIPKNWTLVAYRYIMQSPAIWRSLGVSVYITVVGTLISIALSTLMAYSLSHKALPGRRFYLALVVFTMLFNGGIIPTYFVVRSTGLLNSLWALMIPNAINAFNMIVLRNFFQNIPESLRESAKIDGCPEPVILWKIIVPLSLPALAAFALFYAVEKWNIYFNALLYLSDSRKWPVQVLLRQIIYAQVGLLGEARGGSDDAAALTALAVRSAVIVVATVPIVLVYPFLQRHFVKGLLVGSVKG
jgi:putative aldouronate transport system permease protein